VITALGGSYGGAGRVRPRDGVRTECRLINARQAVLFPSLAMSRIIHRVSADPTVVVALVGLVGTLGAAALTQFVVIRNKRLDAEIKHRSRVTELTAAASEDKLATYVQLNAAARDFRSVGHDYLVDKLHGAAGPENLHQIEEVRAKYREAYARAQMILPDECSGWLMKLTTALAKVIGRSTT